MVLLYHFFERPFRGGYLGVDIFFVISGYIVSKSNHAYFPESFADSAKFLRRFYINRVARLLPAGLFVSVLSVLCALYFSPESNLKQTLNFFISSFAGFANIYLYLTGGNYFGLSQEFNFFTQTWSLGVEEQFYVIYSLLIFLAPFFFKKLTTLFLTITIISFVLNLNFLRFSTIDAHFYLIPFRLWEMGLGVLLFLEQVKIKRFFLKYSTFFKYYTPLGLTAAFFIKYSPNSFPFPILVLILPAAIEVIVTSDEPEVNQFDKILSSKFLGFFGTISYSLYLIHWPIVVLAKYVFGRGFLSMGSGMLISVLAAHFITKWIEVPSNLQVRKHPSFAFIIVLLAVGLAIIPKLFYKENRLYVGRGHGIEEMQWKQEFKGCIETSSDIAERKKNCFTPKRDKERVIFSAGDSHAGQMAIMLKEFAKNDNSEVVLMHSGDKANSIHSIDAKDWKEHPALFEDMEANGKSDDIVVITFASYHWENISQSVLNNAEKIWKNYLTKYLQKNMEVILVIDSPHYQDYPIESCLIDPKRCTISREEYLAQRKTQANFFLKLKYEMPGIRVWDMMEDFCPSDCSVFEGSTLTYFDYNHISKAKAKALAKSFQRFLN